MQRLPSWPNVDEGRSKGLAVAIVVTLLVARHLSQGLDLLNQLMLVSLLVCLVPALDSLHHDGSIRVWDRWRIRFSWVDRHQATRSYWINLLVSWPGAVLLVVALVAMPPR